MAPTHYGFRHTRNRCGMKLINQLCLASAVAAGLMAASTCTASIVYEAKYTGSGLPYYSSGNAYGDEIVLAGTDRVLTGFHFAYYSDYDLTGGLSFALYENDGPLVSGFPSPGTSLFSATYDVVSGPSGTDIDIPFTPDPSDPLPDRFTFVVQFLDMAQHGTAGLLIADAPTIGTSGNDFWEDDAWEIRQLVGFTSNFEATVNANAVPEATPSVATTLGLAGLGIFAAYRRTQRK
jgi:hypothetical protein